MDTRSGNPFPEILNQFLTQESCRSAKKFMELQAFEVHVCGKAETGGLEMAFLVTVPWAIVSVISQLFQGEPNGI